MLCLWFGVFRAVDVAVENIFDPVVDAVSSWANLVISDACLTVANAFEKSNEKTRTKSFSTSTVRTSKREPIAEVVCWTRLA